MILSEIKRSTVLVKRKYIEYFVPTVLTAMATNIAIMVDATIVGNILGSSSLAAVNLLSPVTQLYFSLSILFGLAAATIIARAKGKDGTDRKVSDGIFTTTVFTLVILSIILMTTQFVFIDNIIGALTSDTMLKELMHDYYIPTIMGTPITLLMTSSIHIVRTDGRPQFASNIIIISNVINLIMDLVTIKILGLGIMGASIATVTGNTVGFILVLTHFKRKDSTLRLDLSVLKNVKQGLAYFWNLITTGISGALGTMLITIKILFLNTLIQKHGGQSAIVAYSVVSMCQVFVSAFVTGASQTMIPIVSLFVGEGDAKGVKIAFRQALKILLISSMTIVALSEIIPDIIAALYGVKQGAGMDMAVSALRISSLLFPALALSFLGLYYFMAIGKKVMSIAVSVVNGIVFVVPFALILSKYFGINGVWWSLVCAQYATVLFVLIGALIIKLRSKGVYKNIYLLEEDKHNEVLAFTMTMDDTNLQELRDAVAEKTNGELADTFASVMNILNTSKLLKKHKNNISDVRVCKAKQDTIIIKNSGADVDYKSFERINEGMVSVSYAKSLGFNQIRIEH